MVLISDCDPQSEEPPSRILHAFRFVVPAVERVGPLSAEVSECETFGGVDLVGFPKTASGAGRCLLFPPKEVSASREELPEAIAVRRTERTVSA